MSDMGRVAIQERRTGKADHRNQDGDDLFDPALFFISHILLSKESSNAEGLQEPAEKGSIWSSKYSDLPALDCLRLGAPTGIEVDLPTTLDSAAGRGDSQ